LPSGQHSLQLVLGDYIHTPHNRPVVSEVINITVDQGTYTGRCSADSGGANGSTP
jgi:hypothetical protein